MSLVITLPKTNNPKLILIPSLSTYPTAPVFLSLSDPAKSTKWNLAVVKPSSISQLSFFLLLLLEFSFRSSMRWDSMDIVNIACERED